MAKILVVEDDPALQESIKNSLSFQHHTVLACSDGREGLERLLVEQFDLVILDWQLPSKDGPEICREYREKGGTSIVLMLTGKSSVSDKETGFDAGADDYLTKPFNIRELIARVRALLRRPAQLLDANKLQVGDLVVEPEHYRVTRQGKEIKLTPREFALLEFLIRNPGKSFTSEVLLSRVWGSETDTGPDAVRLVIKRLRDKVDTGSGPSIIQYAAGIGYKLVATAE
jgi:DNA-binding response OmpR family regulator